MQPIVLGRRESPVEWHEAAAIVHAVADAVAGGTFTGVPAVTDLALAEDGTLCAAPGAGSSVGRVGHDGPARVAGLRRLLADLLPDAAPPQLVALAHDAEGTQGIRTSDEFIQAVAFFERPSKARDLRALAGRLREAEEARRLETELERLTDKARLAEPGAAGADRATAARPENARWTRRVVLVAGGALAITALLIVVMVVPGPYASPVLARVPDGLARGLTTAVRNAAASALKVVTRTKEAPPAVATPVTASGAPAPRTRRTPARRRAPASQGRGPVVDALRIQQPEIPEALPSTPFVTLLAFEALPAPSVIYDRDDPHVRPATLQHPRLPRLRAADGTSALGVLEVIVGPDGQVEHVRLASTSAERRFYDAMMIPAVKAWIFQPATRAGHPVRYRLRVPLT